MLTDSRWQREQELMQSVFPEFTPFNDSGGFGFKGHLRGERSGTRYRVILKADEKTYPQSPPNVLMDPQLGMCWIGLERGRKLCMEREWRPARSTFANTLLAVIRYVHEFDSEPQAIPTPGRVLGANGRAAESRASPTVTWWVTHDTRGL
jgi:hypothetical protein